jgi:hypothetical protein
MKLELGGEKQIPRLFSPLCGSELLGMTKNLGLKLRTARNDKEFEIASA